ncbi:MAG: efflux RND transporter permease subunit [Leptospiraceae bacterium]|nr:efflux RND transporter permease subunit [Leptospiraceae bacterium]MCP5498905.1 efflux RND transporter permease subunit [Leptospiraceae bacterium]
MIRLSEYFLKHPRVTNMVIILVFLAGIFASLNINRQANPPISFDVLTITTLYPGASPEDVEINLTHKIEKELLEVENIKKMNSISMENLSIITLQLDADGGDVSQTRINVRDAVGRVSDLPASILDRPRIEELKTSNFPAMEISINGDVSELELRKYAKDLEELLREVPGVARINKLGFRKREVHIEVNMKEMREQQVSFFEIINSIRNRNIRSSGGTIESYISEKKVVTVSEYENLLDVKDVIIRSNFTGNRLRISDIAEVRDDFEDSRLLYRGNGKPSIILMVNAQENSDIIRVSDKLHEKVELFQKNLSPGVKAEIIFDYSVYTRIMISMVRNNGISGFILVFIVMFIFLDLRSAFWSAFGIPLCIFGSLLLFVPIGLTINNISLVTMILVLGILVDDAIVITENIYSYKQSGMDAIEATLTGVKTMILPVSASILTTIFAFTPILFISGLFGKFLYPIPIVVSLLLCFSWLESILFLPAHLYKVHPPKTPPRRSLWVYSLKNFYHNSLYTLQKRRGIYLVLFLIVLVLSIAIPKKFLDFIMDSDRDTDFLSIKMELPVATSLKVTKEKVRIIEKLVEESVPKSALIGYTTNVGTQDDLGSFVSNGQFSNKAVTTIFLVPAQSRSIVSEDLMKQLSEKFKTIKKEHNFIELSINKLGGGGLNAGKAVDISYISDDNVLRNRFEKETLEYLKSINGVKNIETTNKKGKDEIRLVLNYEQLARASLSAIDVTSAIRSAFDGTVVTSLTLAGEEIYYRVRIKDASRLSENRILEIPITNHSGNLVPLRAIASLKNMEGPVNIHHTSGKRSVTITADVDLAITKPIKVNELLSQKFDKRVASIPGLRLVYGGQQEEFMVSMRGFYFALAFALISIYFLLVVLFNSYSLPFLIMSIIPFAVAGVFLALFLHNMPITFVALIGMLGLIGVVVNDTIVMISHLNTTCKEKGYSFASVAEAASERFRPVILTSLTTFAGLLPTSYGLGGDIPEIRPMVLTMAWGLVYCTFITLGFIPLLYSMLRVRRNS